MPAPRSTGIDGALHGLLTAVQRAASGSGAFACLEAVHGTELTLARLVDGSFSVLHPDSSIEELLELDSAQIVVQGKSVCASEEVWSAIRRPQVRYLRDLSVPDGFVEALLVFLCGADILYGVAAVERRRDDPAFSPRDVQMLQVLAPLLVFATVAMRRANELAQHGNVFRELGARGAAESLSAREKEVAGLLAAGYSHVNIAARWGVSPNTVRTYVRRAYAKLGVANRADLVRLVLAHGSWPARCV